MTPQLQSPLTWDHPIKNVGPKGISVERQATAAEREALRSALDVLAVNAFGARYSLAMSGSSGFVLAGHLTAKLSQACVVTLEPVEQTIAEEFSVSFVPPSKAPQPDTTEHSVLDEPDVEILTGDVIEAGRVLFELLSAAIDPYPRKGEAEFDWQDPKTGPQVTEALNPFSALKKLKTKD